MERINKKCRAIHLALTALFKRKNAFDLPKNSTAKEIYKTYA